MPNHTCLHCGATFQDIKPRRGRRRTRFCFDCLPCSGEMDIKAYQVRYNELCGSVKVKETRHCSVCGDAFEVRKTARLRCVTCTADGKKRCIECRRVFSNARGYWRCPDCRTVTCSVCGGQFARRQKNHLTCSSACREELASRTNKVASRRRRLRRKGAIKGPYHDLEVFDRDGWRCQICGGLVRPWHRVPHPLAPTIDHIVPLSKGGDDVASNVQCAHSKCNTRKNAGAANDQLRLVG